MLTYQSLSHDRAPLSRRASGVALAVGVNVLLLLVLLSLGVSRPAPPKASPPLVIDFVPEAHNSAPPAPAKATVTVTTATPQPPLQPLTIPRPPIVVPAKPTITPPPQSDLLEMSAADLAASDIGHIARSGDGSDGNSEEVGRAPNGEVLYAAEWARRPTDAEVGGYLPRNAPDGYGLVACKTIPDDRVENCQELDQQPLGSGLARAVREAAWQFRVRPPRKNGHELIGSWVRIRIDYEGIGESRRNY